MVLYFKEIFSKSRLRTKFILFFVIFASVPTLVLGGVSLYLIDISHREDVSNLELQLIDQKIEEVEKFFAETLGTLELFVSTDKLYIESSEQFFLLDGLLADNKAFEEVSLINLRGMETEKRLKGASSGRPDEADLFDVSRLPKFENLKTGKNYIGDVHNTLSGPLITLAASVRNRNGEIMSYLSAEVNLLQILKSVESASLGSAGYLALLDKDGSLISRKGFARAPIGAKVFGARDNHDRYESVLTGEPVVGARKAISKIGWTIMAEWPISDADAIIKDVRNQVVTLTIISIIAVFLLAPFFALRLLRPIHALEAGAAKIEAGDFEGKVEIKTDDELEDLGMAFNKMTQGLKRLQELKNEFVFIAAHELRTPVTAIRGYVSMALEALQNKSGADLVSYLEPVERANERLINLVNDILEIARSEAGRITIEVYTIDTRLLIRSTLLELKPLAGEKNISFLYDEPKEMKLALTDPGRFREALTNLVSNAVKYNNKDGWVKIYHEETPEILTTHVEDNGFGMSADDQKHMFEKFFRAEIGKTKSIVGTGLGMFITKELVEKMGGKIWFKSEKGKGSRFSFSLPRPTGSAAKTKL